MSIEYKNYIVSGSRSPIRTSRRGAFKSLGKSAYSVPNDVKCAEGYKLHRYGGINHCMDDKKCPPKMTMNMGGNCVPEEWAAKWSRAIEESRRIAEKKDIAYTVKRSKTRSVRTRRSKVMRKTRKSTKKKRSVRRSRKRTQRKSKKR